MPLTATKYYSSHPLKISRAPKPEPTATPTALALTVFDSSPLAEQHSRHCLHSLKIVVNQLAGISNLPRQAAAVHQPLPNPLFHIADEINITEN
jgi:hypothetical protein